MTNVEFNALLEKLDLRPDELAALGGVSLRSVYRYLDGSRRVPPAVVAYLRLYEKLDAYERAVEWAKAGLKVA